MTLVKESNHLYGTLLEVKHMPTRRQETFHWSKLHLEIYWLGNCDKIIAQTIGEPSRNLRADISRVHRSSLSGKRRFEAGAGKNI